MDEMEFAEDLNEAAETWYVYSEAMFGPVEWRLRPDGKREQVSSPERNAAWEAWLSAYLLAKGWHSEPRIPGVAPTYLHPRGFKP